MNQSTIFDLKFEEQLISILKDINPKNILIVTGKKSFDKSVIKDRFMSILSEYNIFRFSDFRSNTNIDDVKEGVKVTLTLMPDLIIAIGGGSVIDMAKQINIFAKHKNILKIVTNDQNVLGDKLCPLVAIPTTAGTGSEITHFAVLYINNKKYSVAHKNMVPDYSIIDSTLSHTMSVELQATCGFDALSQAIESYWSIQSTDESKQYASDAIDLILKNFKDSIDGNDHAKSNMSKAAYLSGKAINISKTTAAHAVSYPLTIHYKISHGHAVALTLGYFFEINSQYEHDLIIDPRGHQYIQKIMSDLYKLFNKDNAEECKRFWYKFMDIIGLETNPAKLGIFDLNDIDKILDDVDPVRIANNPIRISKDNIKQIFLNLIDMNK